MRFPCPYSSGGNSCNCFYIESITGYTCIHTVPRKLTKCFYVLIIRWSRRNDTNCSLVGEMIVGELRVGEMSLNLSNLLCSLSTFTPEHKCMFMASCHSSLLTETWSESLTTLDYKFEFTSEWKHTISGLWSDQYKKGHWDNKKLCRQYTCFLPVTNARLMPVAQLIWHDAKTCLCLPKYMSLLTLPTMM